MSELQEGSLVDQYRLLHDEERQGVHHFPGRSILPHAWIINQLIRKHPTQSILDYGCGLGLQYTTEKLQKWWGIMPTLYDPAVRRHSTRPQGKYDGVICSDVLEHIPLLEVEALIRDVYAFANAWVFFSVCCRPARRRLPNGMNAHVTILDQKSWQDLIYRNADRETHTRIEFNP